MTLTDTAAPTTTGSRNSDSRKPDIRKNGLARGETSNLAAQGKSTLSRISGGATTEIFDPHTDAEIESPRKLPLWLIPAVAVIVAAGGGGAAVWYFHSVDKIEKPAAKVADDSLKPIIELTKGKAKAAAGSDDTDPDDAMLESGFKNSIAVKTDPARPFNLQRGQPVAETYDSYISAENIAEVERSHVRKLSMVRCIFDNKALAKLSNVGIQTLNISLSNLDDLGAEGLTKYKLLMVLNIDGTKITDKAGKSLAKIETLRSLDISRNGISDAFLATISTLPYLSDVVMNNTSVTPEGVTKLLRRCRTMKRVHLGGCRFITDQDIKKLKAEFPDLTVVTQNLKFLHNDPNHLAVPEK